MRTFNYSQEIQNLLTPEIVQLLTCIHEHKGRQDLFLEANTDELKTLVDVAMIQSTGSSNRIEGIFTSDKRLEALVSKKAEPHNRSEQEIAGYREVLALIHENHDHIPPAPNVSGSSTEICTLTQQEPLEETIKTQITSLQKQMHKGTKRPGLFPFLLFRQLTLWILYVNRSRMPGRKTS